jgi:hypothetical protein
LYYTQSFFSALEINIWAGWVPCDLNLVLSCGSQEYVV